MIPAAIFWAIALVSARTMIDPTPAPQSPITVLLVEFTGAPKHLGQPLVCPGDSAPAKPDDWCVAEVYEAPFRVVRRIGGDKAIHGRTLRYTIAEFGMPEGSRALVAATPMTDGKRLAARWWRQPDDDGEICLDRADAESLGIAAPWSRWPAHTERLGSNPPTIVRCLRP